MTGWWNRADETNTYSTMTGWWNQGDETNSTMTGWWNQGEIKQIVQWPADEIRER